MTAEAHKYDDLHRLVDRLEPGQAEAVRAVVLQLVTAIAHAVDGDDLDQGDADETVSFALDGTSYEIDLSSEDAAELRDALTEFVSKAHPIGGPKHSYRKFSFAGSISAEPDFAARSEEILEEIANRNTA